MDGQSRNLIDAKQVLLKMVKFVFLLAFRLNKKVQFFRTWNQVTERDSILFLDAVLFKIAQNLNMAITTVM